MKKDYFKPKVLDYKKISFETQISGSWYTTCDGKKEYLPPGWAHADGCGGPPNLNPTPPSKPPKQ